MDESELRMENKLTKDKDSGIRRSTDRYGSCADGRLTADICCHGGIFTIQSYIVIKIINGSVQ